LTAIKFSLLWIKQNYEKYGYKRNVVIFSDSLSSLSAIKTGKSSCRPQMLDEILHLINEIQVDIHFVWIYLAIWGLKVMKE